MRRRPAARGGRPEAVAGRGAGHQSAARRARSVGARVESRELQSLLAEAGLKRGGEHRRGVGDEQVAAERNREGRGSGAWTSPGGRDASRPAAPSVRRGPSPRASGRLVHLQAEVTAPWRSRSDARELASPVAGPLGSSPRSARAGRARSPLGRAGSRGWRRPGTPPRRSRCACRPGRHCTRAAGPLGREDRRRLLKGAASRSRSGLALVRLDHRIRGDIKEYAARVGRKRLLDESERAKTVASYTRASSTSGPAARRAADSGRARPALLTSGCRCGRRAGLDERPPMLRVGHVARDRDDALEVAPLAGVRPPRASTTGRRSRSTSPWTRARPSPRDAPVTMPTDVPLSGCLGRKAVAGDHALVVEAQQGDHVLDVGFGLDPAGAKPRPDREDRWPSIRPCSNREPQDLLGKPKWAAWRAPCRWPISPKLPPLKPGLSAPSRHHSDPRPGRLDRAR